MIKLLAKIGHHYPKFVIQARSLKAIKRFVNLNGPFDKIPHMMEYVWRAELANADNKEWAMKADKLGVRDFVAERIGKQYLIPLLGAWKDASEIDFNALPDSFILKTNNGCATNVFVHNKSELDIPRAIKQLNQALVFPYPDLSGQPHYALISPRIIAEKLMVEPGHTSLTDYKIHCVNGEPVRIYVFLDRDEKTHFDFRVMAFDPEWKEYPEAINKKYRANPSSIDMPENISELLQCARELSKDEEYARIDFYIINGKIYFGEITLTPDTAAHPAYPLKGMNAILDKIKADRKAGLSKNPF